MWEALAAVCLADAAVIILGDAAVIGMGSDDKLTMCCRDLVRLGRREHPAEGLLRLEAPGIGGGSDLPGRCCWHLQSTPGITVAAVRVER